MFADYSGSISRMISLVVEFYTSRAYWRNAENERRGMIPFILSCLIMANGVSGGRLWWERCVRTPDGLDSKCNSTTKCRVRTRRRRGEVESLF